MSDLDRLKADHESANGSEVVVRHGLGAVAFEERMGEYVVRYEAESVPQLIELMEQVAAKMKRDKEARQTQQWVDCRFGAPAPGFRP